MLPHSYATDYQTKSQELATTILAATSSAHISSACASTLSFLRHLPPDHSRWFFSLTFPSLICKLFGFDSNNYHAQQFTSSSPAKAPRQSSSNGWIETVSASSDSDLADTLFNLLSPEGVLIAAISAVDRLGLVKYFFPVERLPEWVKYMLSNERDSRILTELCPVFKNKVKEDPVMGSSFQVQLNVFEYYIFWFAYYPVCKGNYEKLERFSVKKSKKFRLESWTSSIKGFSSAKRAVGQKMERDLYIRLLHAYLRAFVPTYDMAIHQPYRSSLLHYASGYDASVYMLAEFLVHTLIHFWLVDNDFSPLPVSVCKSFGVSFSFRPVLGKTPPTVGLAEAVKFFVKYLNLNSASPVEECEHVEYSGSPRQNVSGSIEVSKLRDASFRSQPFRSISSWSSLIQRPLYRFILRTYLFCPVETSITNVSQVVSLWSIYVEPWNTSWEEFADIDMTVDTSHKFGRDGSSQSSVSGYSPSWQGYVLSNYLFYSSLVMHFIGFAHKFLHVDAQIIVQMVLKVLNILTSSRELMDLVKNVDTVFHSKQAGSGKQTLQSLYKFVPSIREQLQDWEDGLCESDADGSFLHENWNKDLRLFSDGEDGGQRLLQLFILRAESELQAVSGNNLFQNLQLVDSLKSKVGSLFGARAVQPVPFALESPRPVSRDEIFKPRGMGGRPMAGSGIKYKGDGMRCPASDDEIACLAGALVRLSAWLNDVLGLNEGDTSNARAGPKWSYVDVRDDAGSSVEGPLEAARMGFGSVGSGLLAFCTTVLESMRKHNLRVNLRILASKKVVTVVVLSVAVGLMKRAFTGLLSHWM